MLLKEQAVKRSQFCSDKSHKILFTVRGLKEKIKLFTPFVMGHNDVSRLTVMPWAAKCDEIESAM